MAEVEVAVQTPSSSTSLSESPISTPKKRSLSPSSLKTRRATKKSPNGLSVKTDAKEEEPAIPLSQSSLEDDLFKHPLQSPNPVQIKFKAEADGRCPDVQSPLPVARPLSSRGSIIQILKPGTKSRSNSLVTTSALPPTKKTTIIATTTTGAKVI